MISLIVTSFSKQWFDLERYTNPYESGPTFLQTSMILTALKLVTRPLSHKLAALSHKISVSSSCNSAPYTNCNEFEPPKFLSLKVCCKTSKNHRILFTGLCLNDPSTLNLLVVKKTSPRSVQKLNCHHTKFNLLILCWKSEIYATQLNFIAPLQKFPQSAAYLLSGPPKISTQRISCLSKISELTPNLYLLNEVVERVFIPIFHIFLGPTC